MYQALQIFSQQFQQFDFVWQLEMHLRLIGHAYEILSSAAVFAQNEPRENLRERNGRFYIPELHDKSNEKFTAAVNEEVGDSGTWGAVNTTDFTPQGPQAPVKAENMAWGIGEDADLFSFMPMIDPIGTNWVCEDRIYGFTDGESTPRRAAFISKTRFSHLLLQLVHEAQSQHGQWLVSEATMETFALMHGLKAVSIPHPIAFANSNDIMAARKPDQAIHMGPKHSKAGGHNPSLLYTKQGYVAGPWEQSSYWWSGNEAPRIWHQYLGGECLPPMLLHPVKD
ncbi:hypothetical protein PFICI_11101 [Pestalotiopsis fici W106-1]|uniref:Uncharacterized protein n=1 Tax=Pestalotiopsis fici (strain W106-1 / CGMCC3.15140) TaxID=1229662 RepID=W3WVU8_PESFW|nr:uncharacterized protein PFICI_11101 [Pestalotiopsis fici W106-1]ETS77227.1 hypothetical protein PFICI_11101 [Pestalotiopsis fici W106-1]